jgi:hypothetical protein
LVKITTKIVTAYVSKNQIATADLAGLITAVAGQLGKAGAEPVLGAGVRFRHRLAAGAGDHRARHHAGEAGAGLPASWEEQHSFWQRRT